MKVFCNVFSIRCSDAVVYQTAMNEYKYSILDKDTYSYTVWFIANVDYNVWLKYNRWLMIDYGYNLW